MIARDAAPIAHHTPRPRIETDTVWPKHQESTFSIDEATAAAMAEAWTRTDADRIWALVQSTAKGSNVGERDA